MSTGQKLKFAKGFKRPSKEESVAAIGSRDNMDESESSWFDGAAFEPVPEPSSIDDWLAQYNEQGQTYEQFLDECPWLSGRRTNGYGATFDAEGKSLTKRYPDGVVYLAMLGEERPGFPSASALVTFASTYLGLPVKLWGTFKVRESPDGQMLAACPSRAEDASANRRSPRLIEMKLSCRKMDGHVQINCPRVLKQLKRFLPQDGLCLVALTAFDLYEANSDLFVAGLASGIDRVALFSFCRYDPRLSFSPELWHDVSVKSDRVKEEERRATLLARTCKLLVHEVCHLLGLDHCIFFACCMNGSGHLTEDFAQPIFMCPVCLRKLWTLSHFDVRVRYKDLAHFFAKNQMQEERSWIEARLLKAPSAYSN
jgi:archaemetzincin